MQKDNDYELVLLAQEGNEDAINILYKKYNPIIIKKSKDAFFYTAHYGIDIDDIIQECWIGFDEAIKNFSQDERASFYTFSMICIERKISNYLKKNTRNRDKILNEAINIDDSSLKSMHSNTDIEDDILGDDYNNYMLGAINDKLTNFERSVLNMRINGYSFCEIAKMMNKDKKAIYNAFHRIKIKFKKIIENDN